MLPSSLFVCVKRRHQGSRARILPEGAHLQGVLWGRGKELLLEEAAGLPPLWLESWMHKFNQQSSCMGTYAVVIFDPSNHRTPFKSGIIKCDRGIVDIKSCTT